MNEQSLWYPVVSYTDLVAPTFLTRIADAMLFEATAMPVAVSRTHIIEEILIRKANAAIWRVLA